MLLLVVGCSDPDSPAPDHTDGSPTGGTGAAPACSGGLCSGRQSGTGGGLPAGGTSAASGGSDRFGSGGQTSIGGLGGAAGTSGSDGTVPASFDTVQFVIRQAPCFGAGCHNDDQNPLDLRVDDELYTRLTSRISENCGNLPIVNPGNPQESALVKMLQGPCGETPRMPVGCVDDTDANCVPPEYIAAIEQWIANGAPGQ